MTNLKIRTLAAAVGLILVVGLTWSCTHETIVEKEIRSVALMNCETEVHRTERGPMVFMVVRNCTVQVVYEDDSQTEQTVSDTFDVVGPGEAGEGGEGEGGGTG